MINENFIFIGLLLQTYGGWQYLVDTVKGKIQPNKISWFLWSLAPLIAFVAEVKQGVGLQSLTTFIVGFIPLVVFIASFVNKKAVWKLGSLDFICGVLSLLGLLLWVVTKVGNIAILFSILADALAAVPTIVKSYKTPESESVGVYSFGAISAAITILTIRQWNFATWGFPVYLFFLDILITALVYFKLGKQV